MAKDFKDASLGSIMGAFIGDAAGAVLEFCMSKINEEGVENALTFPGGGVMRVEPGQITDDSEMAMCILHGLKLSGPNTFSKREIAKQYIKWYNSNPFDMGMTTRYSLAQISDLLEKDD